jgi:deoxyribonuclease IV
MDLSVDRAMELGCSGAFQIFTCSPRRWEAPPLDANEVTAFRDKVAKSKYRVYAHMPYLPNLSSPDFTFLTKSINVLTREVERCTALGVENLVLHFGSHRNTSLESGKKRIVEAAKKAISNTPESTVRLLFENSADAKSVGTRFEMIDAVLKEVNVNERTGVCLDTCHAFASGYDLRNEEAVKATSETIASTVGLNRLYLIHLNDSKGKLGSASDRHEDIGKGQIGVVGMTAILNSPELNKLAVVLETPLDFEGEDKQNLATTKKLIRTA